MSSVKIDAKAIFLEALDCQNDDEQKCFLAGACGFDTHLRLRVEELLLAHGEAGAFLGGQKDAALDLPMAECPGTVIGPYKLMEQIGEGGMGLVFVAEQQHPVRRKVAVKVIKPGMDTREVVARFEAERQALALMDHPNIARVFDAGATDSGRPYFVMELVRGVDITKFCDDGRLTTRERLDLFVHVCLAVQHAHQKGIIHRDLKASNILVTLHDGTPVVKVIDFGVSKAIGQQLTDKTIYTRFAQMIGTPMYMSPEQAEMSGLDIDTRSDIYALGVLLYELLTGTTPFDNERMRAAAFDEMRRIIREEEPPRPSTRFSTLEHSAATVSVNRRSVPNRLSQLFKGELDWIVMKALEKDRNRRYDSASAFASDVQRYLRDEPVQACPPTLIYKLGKIVRRHQKAVLAISMVLLALLGGIIGTTWGMLRATSAEAEATNEANQKTIALTDRETALKESTDQLYLALVHRARAERSSGRVGQRFEALKAIREAARIRITPELRTEAMAALVLPDAEVAQEWERSIADGLHMHFDASFQRYARLDKQGSVTVCRSSNGREEVITRLPVHSTAPVERVMMSPDARFVACGHASTNSMAGRVRVWKLDGPEPAMLLDEPTGIHKAAFAFHPSCRQVAIGHADKWVSVYDLATSRRVQQLAVSAAPFHLAFHPHKHRLAVASGNAVQLFDTDTGKELPALRHPAAVTQTWYVAWHPDGRRLAVSGDDRKIHLWDTETAAEVMSPWTGHTADGLAVAFNHAGDRLASVDWNSPTRLWDTAAGRTLLSLPGVGLQFSSDDRLFGPEYSGNKIRLWRLASGQELRVLRPRSAGSLDNIHSPVLHADGRILAAGARHQLCFFDLASGEELASVRLLRQDGAHPVFFDPPCLPQGKPDGKSGLPGDRSGGWMTGGSRGLYLWPARQDSTRPEVLRIGPPQQITPNPGGGFSNGASASADGRVVAVPQGHSTLVLYRDRPDRRVVLGPQHDVRFSAVSPDGRWVVTCSWESDGHSKTIRIWDAETRLPVHDLAMEGFTSARFSPNGRWLMTSAGDSGSRQWEVGTWREVRHFDRGKFAFSPDSRLLAINDVFSVIRLLDSTTGREVARLTGPDPTWYSPACFTPDGTRLVATCSGETALYVWDLRLIRQQLKELELDWEWPEFPPADPVNHAAKPRQVVVLAGEQSARQAIARYRRAVEADPDSALACNNLAWIYLTAPAPLRDVKAALPLAEKALRLDEKNPEYRNTLGLAYYRVERYREAVEIIRPDLETQEDLGLAFDLYVLAMSHAKLGETARARDYFDWAVRWTRAQQGLSAAHLDELRMFRAETSEMLDAGGGVEVAPPPRQQK